MHVHVYGACVWSEHPHTSTHTSTHIHTHPHPHIHTHPQEPTRIHTRTRWRAHAPRTLAAQVEETFKKRPVNLDQLAEHIHLLEGEQAAFEKTEARFEPLETQYRLLEKFEVAVKDYELERLAGLRGEWQGYRRTLAEVQIRLHKAKADFKDDLLQSLTDFNAQVQTMRNDFQRNAPFDADVSSARAKELIAEYKGQVAALRGREADMRAGLDIFSIEPPVNKETSQTEKDIELLDQVWGMLDEWNANMEEWKYGKFATMDVTTIEEAAGKYSKRILRLQKEVKHWKVLDTLKERVEAIKKLMPLIMDLRNPAMRARHWKQLMDEVGKSFDPNSDAFNLEVVLDLGLEHHQETISALSAAAGKELAIEEAIQKIEAQWETLVLDLTDYKGDYLKLRAVDDLYSALEDNAVGISTMKASRFAASFLGELDRWEKSLSHISETIEMMMGVQRKWMYLESIFVG